MDIILAFWYNFLGDTMKKSIKIKFVDFWDTFNYKSFYIYQYLMKEYNVEISDTPEYIIYSTHGYEHLKYNCIRIFFTIENFRPNFNHCDYAIGFDYITFEDRYIRCPIYLLFDNYLKIFKIAENKHLDKKNLKIKSKFCNMVVTNGLNIDRINFFHKLSEYKQVDSGGKLLNNVGGPVKSKLKFQKNYKFSLAFENSSSNGYTTEKIIDCFAAGGIPIYWGDPLVEEVFNKKAFINGNCFKNYDELIEFIKKVDNNDKLYLKYIEEPMLNNKKYLNEEHVKINKFISHIFDQDISIAKRRCDDNHFVIQEKKYYLLSDKIVKMIRPILKLKTIIKNKLIK